MTRSSHAARARQAAWWSAWPPARAYLLLSGLYLIVVGVAGFVYNSSFAANAEGSRHIFGVFETNGWHNLAGLLGAVAALAFALRQDTARLGALLLGVSYIAVTVALAVWEPATFRIASNGADQVVHALLAVAGVGSAMAGGPRRAPGGRSLIDARGLPTP